MTSEPSDDSDRSSADGGPVFTGQRMGPGVGLPSGPSDGFWLPEEIDPYTGDGRPIRPDLPWLRNLTWTKLHAMQIGLGIAVIAYMGLLLGEGGLVLGLVVVAAEVVLEGRRERSEDSTCDHGLGVHDLIEKPWYGLSAALTTYIVMGLWWGWPHVV